MTSLGAYVVLSKIKNRIVRFKSYKVIILQIWQVFLGLKPSYFMIHIKSYKGYNTWPVRKNKTFWLWRSDWSEFISSVKISFQNVCWFLNFQFIYSKIRDKTCYDKRIRPHANEMSTRVSKTPWIIMNFRQWESHENLLYLDLLNFIRWHYPFYFLRFGCTHMSFMAQNIPLVLKCSHKWTKPFNLAVNLTQPQWCWWQCYVGHFMMMIVLRC